MRKLVPIKLSICLSLLAIGSGWMLAPVKADSEISEVESRRVIAVAKPLCRDYFFQRYRMEGAELHCSIELGNPELIQGWSGRYRLQGRAILRNYKYDAKVAAREQELAKDPNLSAKQIRRIIDSETILKMETVEFEAIVMDMDTKPAVDITVK